MKQSKRNIKKIVLLSLIGFSSFILLFVFLVQIVLLDKFYSLYKKNQVENIKNYIINNKIVDKENLENLAFNNGICISLYKKDDKGKVNNIANRGCLKGSIKNSEKFVKYFLYSDENEKELIIKGKKKEKIALIKGIKVDNYYVFLNAELIPMDTSISVLKKQYIYIAIVSLSISILLSYILSKSISRPIVELSDSAKQLMNGKLDVSFDVKTNLGEIKELANTLEIAKNESLKTTELRNDLMANVGHDLKTPLTMIKAYAEMIRDFDNESKEKTNENLNIIIEETDRLNGLVGDILDLSRVQSDLYELKIEKFDLNELIKKIIKRYYFLIDNEGYEIIYKNKENIVVETDKNRIEQVIYNLINNAVNYTGEDKKVYINVTKNDNKVLVEIRDTGKGIKEKDIKYIWNKYYHNEKKHQRNAIGTGLGLSIVKTILDSHNYKYGVKSVRGKGSTFFFEIDNKNVL